MPSAASTLPTLDRQLILHHYPMSPFAEKIRLILGYKALKWRSVQIPVIMPKPDVIALTGGYRKTPLLQIGADVYCDTALIARILDQVSHNSPLERAISAANATMIATWADSIWFSACVAWATQPSAIKSLFRNAGDEQLAAFAADRKGFRAGGAAPRMGLAAATPLLKQHLARLDRQLDAKHATYITGEQLSVADFALYHPLWFIQQASAVADLLDDYPNVQAWMIRVAACGHGQSTDMSSEDALKLAHSVKPASALAAANAIKVNIAATDYGVDPSQGLLVAEYDDEWVIQREDPRAGTIHLHFPRTGFAMSPV